MEDWLGELKAIDLEATQEEVEVIVEQQDISNEEINVETVKALEDQYRDWHLAVRHRRRPRKWTQEDVGS
jgi:hypothetical protein